MKKAIKIVTLAAITGLLTLTACGTNGTENDAPAYEGLPAGNYATPTGYGGNGYEQPADWGGGLPLTQEDIDIMWDNLFNPETVQVIVNGKHTAMPTPFINREAGLVMVPVSYIVTELGYQVTGYGADITIGAGLSTFTLGEDSYYFARRAPQQLGAAPELKDGTLFVPLDFFNLVLNYSAYISYGNIYIHHITDSPFYHNGNNGCYAPYYCNGEEITFADFTLYDLNLSELHTYRNRFDYKEGTGLVSTDRTLTPHENTKIIFEDGMVFNGPLSNLNHREIIVIYDSEAMTCIDKMIVMYEQAVHPILTLPEGWDAEDNGAYNNGDE
jgi:hypothetical protein